jgi:hypothetical protein
MRPHSFSAAAPQRFRGPLESRGAACYHSFMNSDTQALIEICESLPEQKRAEVADFARFLLAQQDDARWEHLIASPQRRPKLEAFLQESATEPATPLDPSQL